MRRLFVVLSLTSALIAVPFAQMRVVPLDELEGHVALGLALRHLSNVGIFMHTTAHPDDENNGLLVMLNRGQGFRTTLATATRGNGGQNEIGPEIFEALGLLRTGELAALHRFDAAEQYFTRAVDFGYSFSIEETFEKWGRDEITADYVRLIRTIRPDVIITLPPTGNAGGQHHMASAVITRDAYKLAADPAKYPDQIKEGLRPWQPRKLYHMAGFGFPGEPETPGRLARVNTGIYDELLGKTYAEVGSEARSMHKCQGMGQLLSLPAAAATSTYQLVETTLPAQQQKDETSLFDGIDTSVASLAAFAARPPRELVDALATITSSVKSAQQAFDAGRDAATLRPLLDGLRVIRQLRQTLRGMSIDDDARFEIDFRLQQKEREFQNAALIANGVKVEALADDGVVVPGQPVKVNVIVANRGEAAVTVKDVAISGFARPAACEMTAFTPSFGFPGGGRGRGRSSATPPQPMSTIRQNQVAHCEPTLEIPADARSTEPYWHRKGEAGRYTFDADAPFGLPMRPTPFRARVALAVDGDEIVDDLPVQERYEGNIFSGEKRTELLVVPALSVRVTPEIAIVPAAAIRATRTGSVRGGAPSADREVRVTVVNDANGPLEATLRLDVPSGWTATPATQAVKFDREDETRSARFVVTPGPNTSAGEFQVRAVATAGAATFARGYQVVEYPHIRRYHIYDDAHTTLKVIDVRTPPNLRVGYVMGVGDQVPPAIEQLGAHVEMIGADDLAWGDLSRFDAIVTGVRAYERREDLRANNKRLLDYVFNGGTLIVQYNKFEFNDAQYGPYPARVSSNRVTDEFAPPKILDAHNPIFTTPNEIGEAAWKNWVQERGLYFLADDKDPQYNDLIELADNFTYNPGPKRGSLVEASYGKGRWIYVGLGLWRQLPAGTDGAYQLLANLISAGKAKAGASR
jgi:LmbE family N-acetylglucosaminyl deacetylase